MYLCASYIYIYRLTWTTDYHIMILINVDNFPKMSILEQLEKCYIGINVFVFEQQGNAYYNH